MISVQNGGSKRFFEAVTRQLGSSSSSSSRSNGGEQGEPSEARRLGKRRPKFLPSSFLKKKKAGEKELQWDSGTVGQGHYAFAKRLCHR